MPLAEGFSVKIQPDEPDILLKRSRKMRNSVKLKDAGATAAVSFSAKRSIDLHLRLILELR